MYKNHEKWTLHMQETYKPFSLELLLDPVVATKGDKGKALQKGRPREQTLRPQNPKKTSKKVSKMKAKSHQKVEQNKKWKKGLLISSPP